MPLITPPPSTGQLLAYGRRQIARQGVLDVNVVVGSISKILRPVIGDDIEFVTSLDTGIGRIMGDAGQLEQILMNLSLNAKAAMPQGGRNTVETKSAPPDIAADETRAVADRRPCVMLAISDTGFGMDTATRTRIFEPFLTTGGGSGRGLSIVDGIVKQNRWEIRVFSKPDLGTRFEIFSPGVNGVQVAAEKPDMPPLALQTTHPCTTILAVDDNAALRQLVSTVLKVGGYEVLLARDGRQAALELCGRHEGEIGLLLTDLIMPGHAWPGPDRLSKESPPQPPVLHMSGHSGDQAPAHDWRGTAFAYIQKFFTPANLDA